MTESSWGDLPDTLPALPVLGEVPGFDRILPGHSSATRTVVARRAHDGVMLTISAWVFPTGEEAHQMMPRMFLSMAKEGSGHKVEDGPAGGVVGEEMWRPWYASPHHPRASRSFAVRDGRSVVLLHFHLPFGRNENGEYIRDEHDQLVDPVMTPRDLELVESQAALCLEKLTKMGYTSKSPEPKD